MDVVAMCGWGCQNGKCVEWGGNGLVMGYGPIWSIFFPSPSHDDDDDDDFVVGLVIGTEGFQRRRHYHYRPWQ